MELIALIFLAIDTFAIQILNTIFRSNINFYDGSKVVTGMVFAFIVICLVLGSVAIFKSA
jgi:hypothetical protein